MGEFPDLCKLSVGVPPVVASDARLKELFKTAKRSKHINQLVRRDTAEWKLPVQTVYRGLEYARFSLGKCRKSERKQPGSPRSDSWEFPHHNL